MFKRKNRKGFTIVELVIVIAVIGILAAILIPTFVSLNDKANRAADSTLVHNLNNALRIEEAQEGKNKTLHDAVEDLDDYGYKLANLVSKSGEKLLWDQDKDEFVINPGEGEYNAPKFWEIRSNMPEASNKRSIYAGNNWATENVNITNGSGFDAGTNSVSSINYSRAYGETDGTAAHDVVIRTNSGTLTINAASDTVNHYGDAESVNVVAVAGSSYHENGSVTFAEIAKGRIAIEKGAEIRHIHLTVTGTGSNAYFNNITIAKASGVEMPEFSRDPVEIPNEGKLVVALQNGTEEITSGTQLDYVWLTAVGVYEQVTVSNSNTNAGNTYATSNTVNEEKKETAKQIANNITAKVGDYDYIVKAEKVGDEWTYTLESENTDTTYTATSVTVEVSSDNSTATANVVVPNENVTTTTSNSTSDTTEIVNEVTNKVVEVTFKGKKTLLSISDFRNQWNNGDFYDEENPAYVKLIANLSIKEENWGPIGTWKYPFFGTFDGNDKTISDLTNHASADSSGKYTHVYSVGSSIGYGETYGFFGIVGGGDTTIKNVTFNSVDINIENGKNVGAVIGYVPKNKNFTDSDFAEGKWSENTTIGTHSLDLENVTVNGSVEGKSHVAGLIGKMYATGELTLKDCTNNTSVTSSSDYCGGFVAYSTTTTTFTSCTNTGAVHSGSGSVGGLLGRTGSLAVTFDTCTNTGNIESTNSSSFVGGFVGYSNGNAVLTFKKCNNSGNITGTRSGGFFGGTDNATTRVCFIETAVNSGTINGSEYASNFIGILAGACDWDTGTTYDSNSVRNNPNVSISCIKHSDVIFTTVDASKLIATNGKVAKYWTIGAAHGAIVNNLDSETFETTYDATCVNNSTF